jgi:opacity protein-like surface antigen
VKEAAMFRVPHLIRAVAAAAGTALVGTAAFAADMPQPLPQPQLTYQPMQMIVEQPAGAWYLRGDIGIGVLRTSGIEYIENPLNSSNFAIRNTAMGDTSFFRAGVGYEFNNWLRFDVTGEYRTKADVNFFGSYTYNGGTFIDSYQGFLQSVVFLANAYVDLGTWNCVTPFVGVGVGGAYNTFSGLTDIGVPTAGSGVGRNTSQTNFAWALHAGLSYSVTPNFSVELAYRYLNFGSVTDTIDCAGGCAPDSYKLQNLTSQDFTLGVRWRFPVEATPVMVQQAPMYSQPAPVYAQPAPVYTQPAPVYTQPAPMMVPQQQMMVPQPQYPLSTRG